VEKWSAPSKKGVSFSKNYFENGAWANKKVVCGIDEVGRGCLAGPLVCAAVILPINTRYSLLKDSKVMSEADRVKAHRWILKNCWYGIGISHNRLIDTHNIWQTTLLTMKKALNHLLAQAPEAPITIIVDAMPLDGKKSMFAEIPIYHFPRAESSSSSVAAASILAKVTRDNLMREMSPLFPQYALHEHKGYGTAMHQNALSTNGHSIIHRLSFLPKASSQNPEPHEHQQTLC
jgi:ribonuclease HII